MIKRQIQYLRRVRDRLLPRPFAWPPPSAPTARPQTSLGQRPGNAPGNASQTHQGLNARFIPPPCAIQVIKTNRVPKGRKKTRIRLHHFCRPSELSRLVFTPTVKTMYELSVLAAPVAQTCSLSVSVQIVAGRDDFAERGSVSRSTLKAIDALDLSKRWAAGKAPAGHRPALLWLRLRRAALYRRFLTCHMPPASTVPPITNRRYGRLKICATVNRSAFMVFRGFAVESGL